MFLFGIVFDNFFYFCPRSFLISLNSFLEFWEEIYVSVRITTIVILFTEHRSTPVDSIQMNRTIILEGMLYVLRLS